MGVATPTVSASNVARQLSDGNDQGTTLGLAGTTAQGAADQIGFFGKVAPQPAGNAQVAVTRGLGAGTVATFSTKQQPAATVVTLTSADTSVTTVAGTGAQWNIATNDLLILNKAASQAGLGYGNVRVSSAGLVGASFFNVTAGTLTPTSAEVYGVVAIRGFNMLTVTITPAPVVSNTTAEQTFAVTGLRAGELVVLNRNAATQAGLEIVNARVVSNNLLGITWINVTGGTLTPTAAVAYNVISLGGMDAVNNEIYAQISTLAPAAVVTATTATANITSSLIVTNDIVKAVNKPTLQAGLGVFGGKISGTAGLSISYFNVTAGTLTPTANEVIGASIYRPSVAAPLVIYKAALAPASVAATTTAEQTFTVTGVVAASALYVNKPSITPGLGIAGCRVSSTNNIAINFVNITAAAIVPPAETYIIGNFQGLVDTTDGNSLVLTASLVQQQTSTMANALQSALTTTGLIAGA